MLAVFASLLARAGSKDALLRALEAQQAASSALEAGCLRFDISIDRGNDSHFLVYELYLDQAALEEHRSTAHYARWRAAADELAEHRLVTVAEVADGASAGLRRTVVVRERERRRIGRGGGATTVHLVGREHGATAFINGFTTFEPDAEIQPHSHNCDESVVVLEGVALFEDGDGVQEVSPYDATLVPAGVVHRFTNGGDGPLRILWTYASTEATRTSAATGETHTIRSEGS